MEYTSAYACTRARVASERNPSAMLVLIFAHVCGARGRQDSEKRSVQAISAFAGARFHFTYVKHASRTPPLPEISARPVKGVLSAPACSRRNNERCTYGCFRRRTCRPLSLCRRTGKRALSNTRISVSGTWRASVRVKVQRRTTKRATGAQSQTIAA